MSFTPVRSTWHDIQTGYIQSWVDISVIWLNPIFHGDTVLYFTSLQYNCCISYFSGVISVQEADNRHVTISFTHLNISKLSWHCTHSQTSVTSHSRAQLSYTNIPGVKEGPADCIRIDKDAAALKKMKRQKAPGLPGLIAEMIQTTGDTGTQIGFK